MKFEAVIFDLFGTLVDGFGSSGGATHMREMASALGVLDEQFVQLWAQTTEMRIIGAFDSVEANIKHVSDAMNAHPQPKQIATAVEIRMNYVRRALQSKPDALDTLTELKACAYKIGLLSNCSIEIPLLWQQTAFANLIDSPTFSSRARLKKPDPRIYQLACERLGVMPDSCLYIADGEDYELAAAANVGLHPVLIRTPSQQNDGRLHQEAKEWQGTMIASLPEVLQLVKP
jgi:putative hydrolase of the HAD superfamily